MKILQRYIGSAVNGSVLVVLCVLLGMDLFVQFLNEVDDLGRGHYGFMQALAVALLNLPQSVYQFFPMAGLVGSLLGLGTLAAHSELIVMRAAGVSLAQIGIAVIRATLFILIIVTFIGEGIAPRALQWATESKQNYLNNTVLDKASTHGVWMREGNYFIRVGHVLSRTQLQDVMWFKFDDALKLIETGIAKQANFIEKKWVLTGVQRSFFEQDKKVTAQNDLKLTWDIGLEPRLLVLTRSNPLEMSLWDLQRYIQYRAKNNLQVEQYRLIFWQRILQPFSALLMILLAIPFIFGPLRTVTMGLRMITGIAVGMLFYFCNQLFGPISVVYHLSPLLAAVIPTVSFGVVAIWLVRRAR